MYYNSTITRLEKSKLKSASHVWARAFHDDPLWTFFLPDESEREKKLIRAFRGIIRDGMSNGEVYTTSPNLEAVIFWRYSHRVGISVPQSVMSFVRWILTGGLVDLFRMSKLEISRQARVGEYRAQMQKRHAPFPHWELVGIGADPVFQGKGYASSLMRPWLDKMDVENTYCYLETHNRKNVPMYLHYGFEVVEEEIIPGTDINQWTMLRKQSV